MAKKTARKASPAKKSAQASKKRAARKALRAATKKPTAKTSKKTTGKPAGRSAPKLSQKSTQQPAAITPTPDPMQGDLFAGASQPERAPTVPEFPPDFLWGTATAATQIDGGDPASDWAHFSRRPGSSSSRLLKKLEFFGGRYP